MFKRTIVATSTACLDQFPRPHSIRILRLSLHMEGKVLRDGVDITATQFQQWQLQNPDKLATSSPPSQSEMMRFFSDLVRDGYKEAIVLTISSKLSQSYANLEMICKIFSNRLKIHLFDTGAASFAEGVYAVAADKWLQEGMDTPAILY
ncbi:MAG: DegV family protein, partial [Brachymonas sp.]|nr:DegV family protein [Brachymonas sp.]